MIKLQFKQNMYYIEGNAYQQDNSKVFELAASEGVTVNLFQYIWDFNSGAFYLNKKNWRFGDIFKVTHMVYIVLKHNSGLFTWVRHYISLVHNGSHAKLKNITDILYLSMWTAVNHYESLKSHLRAYILLTTSRTRKSSFCGWKLFMRTVATSAIACGMWKLLLLSSIAGIIGEITQTNFTNQNLHGCECGSNKLLYYFSCNTQFIVSEHVWTQFLHSKTSKYCCELKRAAANALRLEMSLRKTMLCCS